MSLLENCRRLDGARRSLMCLVAEETSLVAITRAQSLLRVIVVGDPNVLHIATFLNYACQHREGGLRKRSIGS